MPVQTFSIMNLSLGVRALMNEIDRLAKTNGFEQSRVDVKVNRRGELVIAVLIPPRMPDEWGAPLASDRREAARPYPLHDPRPSAGG